MNLIERISADQLEARKSRNTVKSQLLTTLIGEASMKGKNDGNRASTDSEVEDVIRSFLKNVRTNLDIATSRHDRSWFDELEQEREILESYLPKQMTAEEISEKIQNLDKNKGLIMKHLKENFNGLYDGRVAAQVVDAYIKE